MDCGQRDSIRRARTGRTQTPAAKSFLVALLGLAYTSDDVQTTSSLVHDSIDSYVEPASTVGISQQARHPSRRNLDRKVARISAAEQLDARQTPTLTFRTSPHRFGSEYGRGSAGLRMERERTRVVPIGKTECRRASFKLGRNSLNAVRDIGSRIFQRLHRQDGMPFRMGADGEALRMQSACVVPRHRTNILVRHVRIDPVPATGGVDSLVAHIEREELQHIAAQLNGEIGYVCAQGGNAIEPQRSIPLRQKVGWDVEGGGHSELPQRGSDLGGIALLAIVKSEKAKGSPPRMAQTGQEFVVRDEIEIATEKMDVRPRFRPGERMVVNDDSTTAPTGEAKKHLRKHHMNDSSSKNFDRLPPLTGRIDLFIEIWRMRLRKSRVLRSALRLAPRRDGRRPLSCKATTPSPASLGA